MLSALHERRAHATGTRAPPKTPRGCAQIEKKMSIFNDLISRKGFILADGATGTNYFTLGLETGYPPELWSVERPDEVKGFIGAFLRLALI